MKKFRQHRNESSINFQNRIQLKEVVNKALRDKTLADNSDNSDYIALLNENNIEYVEINITKDSGKTYDIVIPASVFHILSKKDIDKLLKR